MTPAGRVGDASARPAWSGRPALWVSLSVLPTVAACWALQPWLAGSSLAVSLLTQMAWLAIVLLANNLLLGQCGLLSFGHALQVGAGALGAVLAMRWGASGGSMPLPVVPLVGGLAALLLAVPLGFVATRSAGTAFAMVTLALGELAAGFALMVPEWFGGEAGITADRAYGRWWGLDFASPMQVCALAVVYALASAWCLYALRTTGLGRLFNAVRDQPERAAFLGHDPRRLRWAAYGIAAFFAGIGGALGAVQFEIVATADAVGLARSGSYLLFTYLGGSAHFLGPVLGSVAMVLAGTLLARWSLAWPLYLGLAFLLTVMFAPRGVAGMLAATPRAWRTLGGVRWLARVGGALLGGCASVAMIELAYRLRGDGGPLLLAGQAISPSSFGAWAGAAALLLAGALLFASGFRRPVDGAGP